ncbi:MAG TPA: hypothetical protein VLC09_15615 [Polyangiaceae bacterium]|nr:hypothetical protein [Polyangiaceae bacterium]
MTTFLLPRRVAASLALSSVMVTGLAHAQDTADRCLAAHEKVQLDRGSGNLIGAREAAAVCLKTECPAIVRNDCTVWYSELGQEQPSLVVTASQGPNNLIEGDVFIDDAPQAGALDGRAIAVNPGRHVVRLVLPEREPQTQVVVLAIGEARRRVQFEVPVPAATPATPAAEAVAPSAAPSERPVPTLTYVLASTSLAGLLVGGTFGVIGIVERDGLTCAPNCSAGQKDSVDTKFLVADIGYGVGIAAGVAALVTYLARPSVPAHTEQTSSAGFTSVVTPQLAYVGYQGVFQ